jgi:hypothetical protein
MEENILERSDAGLLAFWQTFGRLRLRINNLYNVDSATV